MDTSKEPVSQSCTPHETATTRLIREKEVRARLGNIPRSTLYRMIGDKLLPPAIHLGGGRNAFWLECEIDGRIADLISQSRRGQQ